MKPKCYVASPLGFTEAGKHYYQQVFLPALATIADLIDPWTLVSQDEVREALENGRETEIALEIGRRNQKALGECQILVAVLDGQEVDAGTASEIGYGVAKGLQCFGLRSDIRQSGEIGAKVNLQVEAFIIESGGDIYGNLEELIDGISRSLSL